MSPCRSEARRTREREGGGSSSLTSEGCAPSASPELFDFDYQPEMFKPAARHRWGYFALPVLRRELKDLARWLEVDLVLPG